MTSVAASPAGQTLTAAPPATGAPPVAQGFASVFAGLFEGAAASGPAAAATPGASPAGSSSAALVGLGAAFDEIAASHRDADDDEIGVQDAIAALAPSTAAFAPAPLTLAVGRAISADQLTAVVSPGVEPEEASVVASAKTAAQSEPATQVERAPEPASDAPAAAKAALALDAGVTRIVGQIAAGAPRLETPAALKPPQVGVVASGGAGKSNAAITDAAKTDGSKTDAVAGASIKTFGDRAPSASPDAPSPSPDEDAPTAAGARPEGGPATAPDRSAAGSHVQTAAAPATPQAATQQTPAATAAIAAHAVTQLATEVASKAGARRTRFEVRLDPGELGRVDVRLDIGQDGRLSTRLIVERPETLDMLRNDSRELARTLEQAGFQLGQGGLAFQLKDGRQGFRPEASSAAGPDAGSDEIDEAAPVALAYARSGRTAAGGVDVTV